MSGTDAPLPRHIRLPLIASIMLLACQSGCQWLRGSWGSTGPAPPPISPQPTLEQLLATVHENTRRVQSLSTDRATLSVAGYPSLRADLAFQQPRKLRLRAMALGSTEVDLGSNEELFWVWIKRNSPPAVYYARHADIAAAPPQAIPIEPAWLVESLGLVEFDPNLRHTGPFVRRGGQLEIRTAIPGPAGERTKITVLDGRYGWVLEQHVYDANRQRLASAVASGYAYDLATQTSMPKQVDIQWPAAAVSVTLTLNDLRINQLGPDSANLWIMPEMPGTNYVNLAQIAPATQPPQPLPNNAPTASPPIRESAYGGRTRRY
jgi:hypothetical protein